MPSQSPTISAAERERLRDRYIDFETEIENGVADELVALDGMTAVLTPSLPNVWAASFLRVERPGIPVAEIVAAGDATLGAAGLAHRTVWSRDPAEVGRMATVLKPEGWELRRTIYMALTGEPDRPAEAAVEEVDGAEIAGLRTEIIRSELEENHPGHDSEESVSGLLGYEDRVGAVAGNRWFAARSDGEFASSCHLYELGGVGQVETVNTLARARGRGLARSVVLAAAGASVASGNKLTFIVAEEDDWPRHLYAKLGFEEVAVDAFLRLKPPPKA